MSLSNKQLILLDTLAYYSAFSNYMDLRIDELNALIA